jgi:SAM-dependent methyltransferase
MILAGIRRTTRQLLPRRAMNALSRSVRAALGPGHFDVLMGRGHRRKGYGLLRGHGIEIGALHAPAPLSKTCKVTYVDAISTEQARRLFPEVDPVRLVPVDIVTDLDTEGLRGIPDVSCDFSVLNHVIEHVANPIQVIEELFRVVRPGGQVVISAPDMRFSFDRNRELTSIEHLLAEYETEVHAVTDAHYEEFVRAVMPGITEERAFLAEVARSRQRREHAHVWDSASFDSFLAFALRTIGIAADLAYVSDGNANKLEHFSVWTKRGSRP